MTILVVGASGATGRLLVQQLLKRGHNVKVIVRSSDTLREVVHNHEHLSVIKASILDLSDAEMTRLVNGCAAVAACLGHNLSWRGIYGPPRRLVTDATRRLCNAIKENKANTPAKFVLNEDKVTRYEAHASPTRSALFNAGQTSRINVAHFMADLITDDDTWNRWKGKMPVIYNTASS